MKRKLLSLLLAMAMICSLVPTALATATVGASLSITDQTAAAVDGAYPLGTTVTLTVTASGFTEEDGELSYSWSGASGEGNTVTVSSSREETINVSCTVTAATTGQTATSNTVPVRFADPQPEVVPVTGVTLQSTATVVAGETLQLSASVTPSNATTQDVDWSSSNPKLATVDSNGLVKVDANATGSVIITATSKGTNSDGQKVSATCTVSITEATVDHIDFSGNPETLNAGSTITVTAAPKTAGNQTLNKNVTWNVESPATSTAGITVTSGLGADANKVTIATTTDLAADTNVTISATVGSVTNRFTVQVKKAVVKPTVTLGTPSPSSIYYSKSGSVGAKNTATMTVTTTGDLSGYTRTWKITPANAVTIKDNETTAGCTITAANSVTAVTTVTIQAEYTKTGAETITSNAVTLRLYPADYYELNPSPATNLTVDWNKLVLSSGYYNFSVSPTWVLDGVPQTISSSNVSYAWALNKQSLTSTSRSVDLTSSYLSYGENNTLTCTVSFKNGTTVHTETATWIIRMGYSSSVLATATVSTSTSSYALGDVDDAGKSSIADQLGTYFSSATRGYYGLVSVRFSNVKDGTNGSLNASTNTDYYADQQGGNNARYLSDVLFYPGSAKTTATFQATFYYYNTRNPKYQSDISSVTGSITFNVVESASTGDITYSASIGDDVAFSVKDFEDFYYSKTRGNLSYVSFTLPSGGTLYADGGRLNTSNACYAAPGRTQTDLAGVYFSPSGTTATRAGTVRISFTAYGTRSNASGTVAITYLSGTAKDITYNITTSGTLKASDFTNAYREVVGSTAPTGLTIEFQNVPTYGTLTYKDSSRTNATLVTLRDSNIKSYKFTTRTNGSNQLGDVTYTASGLHTDTIDYIAYVNNTPQFTGMVVFNSSNVSATNMQVGFTSTNGQPVAFSYTEFAKANAVVIASTSYIRFVTMPTGGTLTYGGTTVTLSSTNVPPASLGNVVYTPNAGYNNSTDRISFLCYDANGNSVGGGQVSIVVTGNANNTAAVATVNSFKDVSSTAWYRSDLITLVGAGIIQGRGDGKFDPAAELTYGEALKIFMLASGYPKLAETSGKDWAINYKNLAVSNGWISSTVDLSAKISRNAMAELAAKSLGVAASSTGPPTWTDGTSNSYANALYYTTPQILIGNADGTFMGTSTLKRQEICAIACRVMNYKSNNNQQDLVKPDGI